MKFLPSLLSALVFAQTQFPDDGTDPNSLERGKKKKKKQQQQDTYYTTTTKKVEPTTTTTKPHETTTTKNTNPYAMGGGGGSSGYGDPHFHILGISERQPSLCFDYSEEPGKDLTLLRDMTTGLRVVGELFRPEENSEGIYFKNIRLMTPHKTHLYVDSNSWKVDANLFTNPEYSWETESLTYADLVLGNIHKENHGGHRMTGTIKGGITFEVSTYTAHNNVNFKILNSSHLSSNLGGVIGRFLPPQAYEVRSASPHPQYGDEGTLLFRGQEVDVVFQQHAHNKDCWTLKDWAAFDLIQKTT